MSVIALLCGFQVALQSGCTRYTTVIYEKFFFLYTLPFSFLSLSLYFFIFLNIFFWSNEGEMLPVFVICPFFAGLLIFFLKVIYIFQILIMYVLNLFQILSVFTKTLYKHFNDRTYYSVLQQFILPLPIDCEHFKMC